MFSRCYLVFLHIILAFPSVSEADDRVALVICPASA